MQKQLSCHHGACGLWGTQAAVSETLDLHFWVLRYCRILMHSLTSISAGESRYVQPCNSNIEYLCWFLPSQLRSRWEKLSLPIPSPVIGRRLAFLLWSLLTIFSFLSTACTFSKATAFLSTNSAVYSLTLPQTCAFLAIFSPTAGSDRRGFTSAKWRIMAGAGRELQGTSCAYFFTERTLGFSSSLWEAEFCLNCTMSPLRAKSYLSKIVGHSGQCFVATFPEGPS